MTGTAYDDGLGPVTRALLASAESDAARIAADAARDCDQLLGKAQGEAAAILSRARRQGMADGTALVAAQRATARRDARLASLRLQRDLLDELASRSRQTVSATTRDPALTDRLRRAVRHTLGETAVVRDGDGGGAIGEAAGRRMDLSMAVFVDQAIAELSWQLFGVPDEVSTP